eukprot:c16002_g1_i1.p2 GENE.c16002_g1_i1~~c16002_g1_i1.p2  ORF type:complete len:103 (-),score=21.93 c16002_g1_i1:233-541(-)
MSKQQNACSCFLSPLHGPSLFFCSRNTQHLLDVGKVLLKLKQVVCLVCGHTQLLSTSSVPLSNIVEFKLVTSQTKAGQDPFNLSAKHLTKALQVNFSAESVY